MREPATAIDVLRKANDRGEVGYAHGGMHEDWPAVSECLGRGWIEHARSYSSFARMRSIYRLTEEGSKVLRLAGGP